MRDFTYAQFCILYGQCLCYNLYMKNIENIVGPIFTILFIIFIIISFIFLLKMDDYSENTRTTTNDYCYYLSGVLLRNLPAECLKYYQ